MGLRLASILCLQSEHTKEAAVPAAFVDKQTTLLYQRKAAGARLFSFAGTKSVWRDGALALNSIKTATNAEQFEVVNNSQLFSKP
jgi:hypothetical protein